MGKTRDKGSHLPSGHSCSKPGVSVPGVARPFLTWYLLGVHPLKASCYLKGGKSASCAPVRTNGLISAGNRHRKIRHENSKAHHPFPSVCSGGLFHKIPSEVTLASGEFSAAHTTWVTPPSSLAQTQAWGLRVYEPQTLVSVRGSSGTLDGHDGLSPSLCPPCPSVPGIPMSLHSGQLRCPLTVRCQSIGAGRPSAQASASGARGSS